MNLSSEDFNIIQPQGKGGGGYPAPPGPQPENIEPWGDEDDDSEEGEGKGRGRGEGKGGEPGKLGEPGKDYTVSTEGFGKSIASTPGGLITQEESKQLQKDMGVPEKLPTMSKEQIRDKIKKSLNDPGNFGPENKNRSQGYSGGIGDYRAALADVARGRVDWKRLLKKFIGAKPTGERQVLGNRRHLHSGSYLYGGKENPDGDIKYLVAACDVSGSMSDDDIAIILTEIKSLVKIRGIDNTTIVYFHSQIEKIVELKSKDAVKKYSFPSVKRGGTDFLPPLQVMDSYYKKGQLELGVFMTDGFADIGLPKPKYVSDFIWVILNNPTYTPPWGNKVVHIKSTDLQQS